MPQSFNQELMIPIQEVMSVNKTSDDKCQSTSRTDSPDDLERPETRYEQTQTQASMSTIGTCPLTTSNQQVPSKMESQGESSSLSSCEMRQIDKLLSSAPNRAAISIDALKIIQEKRGWVSDESLLLLSQYTHIPVSNLDSVATFYNLIFRQAVGEIVLHPCNGISCDLMGGQLVRDTIINQLHIQPGQTTADNRFTLIPLPCLGACDKAPVMIAAKQLYQQLAPHSTTQLINQLRGDKS
ncbi:NADH-quinone oxidoreductase subunit NuoE [Shewanella sp. UCD-KL12]|uniref:NADH-quinone oxidoreductase subunit NuoE n=1 Tax=Shewanella sp. UCD-KL12 TaxID=1917163 RepID=UPI002115F778|nr:NADH-quinone oxidoreductase subunit NuoE [Shewanella sp. UCD-KL12]